MLRIGEGRILLGSRVPDQQLLLSAGLLPYGTLLLVDAWMHEKARRVPRQEQWVHAALFVSLAVFLIAVFLGRTATASAGLGLVVPLLIVDELCFHGHLARSEKAVHYLADLALAAFACLWLTTVFI